MWLNSNEVVKTIKGRRHHSTSFMSSCLPTRVARKPIVVQIDYIVGTVLTLTYNMLGLCTIMCMLLLPYYRLNNVGLSDVCNIN